MSGAHFQRMLRFTILLGAAAAWATDAPPLRLPSLVPGTVQEPLPAGWDWFSSQAGAGPDAVVGVASLAGGSHVLMRHLDRPEAYNGLFVNLPLRDLGQEIRMKVVDAPGGHGRGAWISLGVEWWNADFTKEVGERCRGEPCDADRLPLWRPVRVHLAPPPPGAASARLVITTCGSTAPGAGWLVTDLVMR